MSQQNSTRKLTLILIITSLVSICWLSTANAQQPLIGAASIDTAAPVAPATTPAPAPATPVPAPAPAPAPVVPQPPPITTVPSAPIAPAPAAPTTAPAATTTAAVAAPSAPQLPAAQADSSSVVAPVVSNSATTKEMNDMAGRLGFVVGLSGGGEMTPLTVGTSLGLRAWLGDRVAIQPRLQMDIAYNDATEILRYGITPGIGMLFAVYKGKTTRVNLGFGIELGFYGQTDTGNSNNSYDDYSDYYDYYDYSGSSYIRPTAAYRNEEYHEEFMENVGSDEKMFYLGLPIELQIEHFFSERVSGFAGAKFPLVTFVQYQPDEGDSVNNVAFSLDSTSLVLGAIFYTD